MTSKIKVLPKLDKKLEINLNILKKIDDHHMDSSDTTIANVLNISLRDLSKIRGGKKELSVKDLGLLSKHYMIPINDFFENYNTTKKKL